METLKILGTRVECIRDCSSHRFGKKRGETGPRLNVTPDFRGLTRDLTRR